MNKGSVQPSIWILLVLALSACKVSKPASTAENATVVSAPVITQVEMDTIPDIQYLITQKGDTLDSLFQEVDIEIARLLPDTVTIMAVGDMMLGSKFPSEEYLPKGNGEFLWDAVRDQLKSADITFGNLEGTMLDGEGYPKDCKNPDICYLFKMPTRLSSNLIDAGFDLVSVANNHANDFGLPGRKSTQRTLDSIGIAYAGAAEHPYISTRFGHLKVGFVAFAPNSGCLSFHEEQAAISIIKKLDSLNDIVIVSIHGGAEGAKNAHLTRQTEYYVGENRGNIYAFSHKLIDAGADLILGHGPHVVRAVEVYQNKLIAYSLGNFLTYGKINVLGINGEAPILEAQLGPDGTFLSGQIHSYYQYKPTGPVADTQKRALRSIKRLSEEDLPENPIKIDDQGRITYIQN